MVDLEVVQLVVGEQFAQSVFRVDVSIVCKVEAGEQVFTGIECFKALQIGIIATIKLNFLNHPFKRVLALVLAAPEVTD